MDQEIRAIVTNCKICRICQLKTQMRPSISIAPPKGPGRRLAIDLWKCGENLYFTAIDMFAQYPYAISIPDKSCESTVRAMQENPANPSTRTTKFKINKLQFSILKSYNFKQLLRLLCFFKISWLNKELRN